MDADERLKKLDVLLISKSESSILEFKSEFDPSSNQDWCELLKDIIAIANSGGGVILIGLNDDGDPTNHDVSGILAFDPAETCRKIEKYTGSSYSDFRIVEVKAFESRIACIAIGAAHIPIVFSKPGTYVILGTPQQKTAFAQGTLYFRHGAKSEHANPDDLRAFVEREVDRVREHWLSNVRKVVEAPLGAHVVVSAEPLTDPTRGTKEIRVTSDETAPLVRGLDPNKTHPYRQTEIVKILNGKFDGVNVTSHDVFAVRKHYHLEARADLCFKPKFSSAQYSDALIDWVVSEFDKDPRLFERAKAAIKITTLHADPEDERLNWVRGHMSRNGLSVSKMAKDLKMSDGTLSRLIAAKYKGDVARMLQRIAQYRDKIGG